MERLRQRADFLAAAGGRKAATAGFVLQSRRRSETGRSDAVGPDAGGSDAVGSDAVGSDAVGPDAGAVRVGFTVSKKVGNAVERNRVRRRLREIVRLAGAASMRAGHDYVLIGRRAALSMPFQRISEDFKGALRRL